jgi:hypothetical protein
MAVGKEVSHLPLASDEVAGTERETSSFSSSPRGSERESADHDQEIFCGVHGQENLYELG